MKAGEHDVIFVAKKKNRRSHVLLRALRRESLDRREWAFSMEGFNELMLAETPESLVLAVEGLFPLSLNPLGQEEAGSFPRAQTVRQFKRDCGTMYEPISKTELAYELATLKEDVSNPNQRSLKRLAANSDAVRGGAFLRFLETAEYEDDDVVVAEPVQDWLVAKALLWAIVTFQARLNHAENKEALENLPRSGGWRALEGSEHWDAEQRVRPLAYNSESLRLVAADHLPPNGGLLAVHFDLETGTMRGSEHVGLLYGNELPSKAKSIYGEWENEAIDRTLFLGASATLTEDQLASDFIRSLLATARNAKSIDGQSIGWSLDYSSAVMERSAPRVEFHSQWSELLHETAFHSNELEAGLCKNCGRPMLVRTHGKKRVLCSDSCRTKFSSHRKETQTTETNAGL